MCKRLTQPFHRWQPAILTLGAIVVAWPADLHGQTLDSVVQIAALTPAELPRNVVLLGAPPAGVSIAAWETATDAAVATWNDVVCSSAELVFGGHHVERPPGAATAIAFVDPAEERCFPNVTDLGWTLWTACDDWRGTDILLNATRYHWQTEPAPYQGDDDNIVDLVSVITHELGHTLGLQHEDVTDPLATMAPRYLRDGGLASLSADDKLALCDLFPAPASECDAASQCPGECVDGAHGAVCDEVRVGVGGYCDLALLECGSARCAVTSPATFSGYCSAHCDTSDECGGLICEDGYCVFPFTPRVDASCAVAAPGRTAPLALMVLLVAIAVSRRRSLRGASETGAARDRGPVRRTRRGLSTRRAAW